MSAGGKAVKIRMEKHITTPFTKDVARTLRAGERVYITGEIYTARDAAHKRMCEAAARGESMPFNLTDSIIYYAGPAPAKPGEVIGSCGPTTSGRVDAYTPKMLDMGLTGMIGKGERSDAVIASMKKNGAVYFAATGGAGALIAKCVTACEPVAYDDLGAEAIVKLSVRDFAVTVVIDSYGNNIYESGRAQYRCAD